MDRFTRPQNASHVLIFCSEMTNKDKLIHFVYVKYITCITCWNIVLVAVNISCQNETDSAGGLWFWKPITS